MYIYDIIFAMSNINLRSIILSLIKKNNDKGAGARHLQNKGLGHFSA